MSNAQVTLIKKGFLASLNVINLGIFLFLHYGKFGFESTA